MIIDSNILSALFSKSKTRQLSAREFLTALPRMTTSVIVAYEIQYGLAKLGSPKTLAAFLDLIKSGDLKLVDVSFDIATLAAQKRAEQEAKGKILHTEDLIIGATAAILGVAIATENRKDFEHWGIPIVSPLS